MPEHTYSAAGVHPDAALDAKSRIESLVAPTQGPEVLSAPGAFSALYELSGYRRPVLVSSTDGVGTKLKLAIMAGRYETLGEDVVNACVNDVVVAGARPLFFLDYIAVGKLVPEVVELLVKGMARACQSVGCALVGGETAQMPGIYAQGEFDLAGFAVGVVEKEDMLDPSTVRQGDLLLGLPSNGLHTNGYSLVRSILRLDDRPSALGEFHTELGETLGDALLRPHPGYYGPVSPAFSLLKGIAHITGGGLLENVPRILPEGLAARLDASSWEVPPIFAFLQERSDVARDEMYRVFNMGLGLVMVCEPSRAAAVVSAVPGAIVVGEVVPATGAVRVVV